MRRLLPSIVLSIALPLFIVLWLSGSAVRPQLKFFETVADFDMSAFYAPRAISYILIAVSVSIVVARNFSKRLRYVPLVFATANIILFLLVPAYLSERAWFLLYAYDIAPICNATGCAKLSALRRSADLSTCHHQNPRALQYCEAIESGFGYCFAALVFMPDNHNGKDATRLYIEMLKELESFDTDEDYDFHLYSRRERTYLLYGSCAKAV